MRLIKITSCVVLLFILLIFTMSSNTVINTPVIEGQVYNPGPVYGADQAGKEAGAAFVIFVLLDL